MAYKTTDFSPLGNDFTPALMDSDSALTETDLTSSREATYF